VSNTAHIYEIMVMSSSSSVVTLVAAALEVKRS